MQEIEFNLLTEPWVRVRLPDNTVQEVSLTDALVHAQEYMDLAGEMPTQDAAMLRLLLAVLFTVFSRVNEVGEPEPLEDEEAALERWGALWELKHFPEQPIRDYLEQWKDRFWLFHPERPFWQVPEAAIGTEYGAAKLNGEMSESSNKIRLFPLYAGAGKTEMTYAQAVRWLLSVNGYDDTSAKPKGKGLPSVGAGWLGKIGYIQASGENLFETLMLNLTLLKDGTECWGENKPCWELDAPKSAERTEILQPDNPAQLLTLQSRRLLLHRENGKVDGFSLLGGDFFPRESAFVEQMTIWRNATTKKNEPPVFVPCRHDAAKQFWREFPSVFCKGEGNVHQPGVVRWVEKVQQLRFLSPKRRINFRISAVQYGDKDFFVNDSFSDSLAFQAVLLDAPARSRFYFAVDQPFRQWLRSIDPEEDDMTETTARWQGIARGIAEQLGQQMVLEAGSAALVGHRVKLDAGKKTERMELYTAPKAYNRFRAGLYKLYPKTNDEGGTA